MHRRLEPQIMDNLERVHAFSSADKQISIDFFLNCKKKYFPNLNFYEGLDLCCGPAQYDIALSKTDFGIIDAIDGSIPMLKIAEKNINESLTNKRINLKKLHVPFTIEKKYDFIFSINSLHHFHNPRDFWITVKNHSKSKTKILVIDLNRPLTEIMAKNIVDYYSASESEYFREDFYNSLLASFRSNEIAEQITNADLNLNVSIEETSFKGNYMNVIWGEI